LEEADSYLILKLVGLGILICFSALFSASETALFSLRSKRLQVKSIGKLLKTPRKLLVDILVGNTVVNVAASMLAASTSIAIFRSLGLSEIYGVGVSIGGMTILLLLFGEIIPKIFAVSKPQKLSQLVVYPLRIFSLFISPIRRVLILVTNSLIALSGAETESSPLSKEEMKALVEMSEKEGIIERSEKRMMESIFKFGRTQVKEVMVKRRDIVCAELNSNPTYILKLIKRSGFSRIPIFQKSIDNIIGVIHVKDLLLLLRKGREMKSLLQKVYKVQESTYVSELLQKFKEEKFQMVIVINEEGRTVGLVTKEDLIEEIVGEIKDEFDAKK
jgi:CBS domain containing-hemolysin-like protein